MVVPSEKLDPGAFVVVKVVVPPGGQLSVIVTAGQVTICAQVLVLPPPLVLVAALNTVILGGQPTIVGFCVSLTVTVKVQLDELLAASTAFQVTKVAPFKKATPARVLVPVPEVTPVNT